MLSMSVVPHHHHGLAACVGSHLGVDFGHGCVGDFDHRYVHDCGDFDRWGDCDSHRGRDFDHEHGRDCGGHFDHDRHDHDCDHRHPAGHDRDGEAEHSGGCVVDTPVIDRLDRGDKNSECGCGGCERDGIVVALFYFDFSSGESAIETIDYGEPKNLYVSIDARAGGGLRAPPVILC